MLVDQPNPYRPKLPRVLHLDWEDFESGLSDENANALGQPAEWLVVAYLAANCNLAEFLFDNLMEMKSVGSGPKVHVCVLFAGPLITDSFFARLNPGAWLSDDIIFRFSSLRSDDQGTLTMALQLASRYPAQRRLVFLGGHGSGWKGALLNQDLGAAYVREPHRLETPGPPGMCQARLRACQEKTQEYINNKMPAAAPTPRGPIDILAFDACYMGNIESVAKLAAEAGIFVVTEGRAPGQGFPYREILTNLAGNPTQSSVEITNHIIRANKAKYASGNVPLTQTALPSAAVPSLVSAFTGMVRQLDVDDRATFAAVRSAMENSATFGGTCNIDIAGFVTELRNNPIPGPARHAASIFLDQLADSAIATNGPGASAGSCHLSIYGPPPQDFDTDYIRLSDQLPLGLSIWSWFLAGYYLKLPGSTATDNALIRAIQGTMEDLIRRGTYKPQER